MALYQPTNITPSTFAGIGGGVVDVNDRISLSFQVNGTSEMTGWTVTVYTNNAASTQVAQFSIGRDGTPISFFRNGRTRQREYVRIHRADIDVVRLESYKRQFVQNETDVVLDGERR